MAKEYFLWCKSVRKSMHMHSVGIKLRTVLFWGSTYESFMQNLDTVDKQGLCTQ